MTKIAFVDTETTGLDPDRHEIWEVGLIVRDDYPVSLRDPDGKTETVDVEFLWQLSVDLARADLAALKIGRYHERRWRPTHAVANRRSAVDGVWPYPNGQTPDLIDADRMAEWATRFAELTWGAHLVGAVPSFDEERLRRLLRKHGACPGWHYHLIDVETLAVGYFAGRLNAEEVGVSEIGDPGRLPWDSDALSAALGVHVPAEDRHTALGDARWARSIYDTVIGGPE